MLVSQSICYVNDVLKANIFNGFDNGNVRQFGVCELIKNRDGKIMPAEIQANGEATYAGIDDNYSLVSYHRITGISFDVDEKMSFGDDLSAIVETATATMFCYVKTNSVNISAADMASKIAQSISIVYPKQKLIELSAISGLINPVSAQLDTKALLKQEYNIEDLELVGDAYMFAINYQIKVKYNACQNACTI